MSAAHGSTVARNDRVVCTRTEGRMRIITLNRHETRNAVNMLITQSLERAMMELDQRPELRAGALRVSARTSEPAWISRPSQAEKGRGFPECASAISRNVGRANPRLQSSKAPPCLVGSSSPRSATTIVASGSAYFGLPGVGRMLVASTGGLLPLQHRLSRGLAMELVPTGRRTRAAESGRLSPLVTPPLSVPYKLGGSLKQAKTHRSRYRTQTGPSR